MTRKQRRLTLIASAGIVLAIATALVLTAFQQTITLFMTPADIEQQSLGLISAFGWVGLVAEGTVVRGQGTEVSFVVADEIAQVPVVYAGILPDLFREGQGIVAEGILDTEGTFIADTVLAKHDENYMPKEVADALKEQGVWKQEGNEGGAQQ